MIEVLGMCGVVDAAHAADDVLQTFFEHVRIALDHGVQHVVECRAADGVCQVFEDFAAEDTADFAIRQCNGVELVIFVFVVLAACAFEVAGVEEQRVEVVDVLFDVFVDESLVDAHADGAAPGEFIELPFTLLVDIAQHRLEDAVAGRPHPVGARLAVFHEVVVDRPRIVDFCALEIIAVIPRGELFELVIMAEVVRHFCNFGFRVATGRGVAAGKSGGDAQVVEPAEDAFFRDAQNAREDGEAERGIRFQCRGIEAAKEADGFVVIAVRPCTLKRSVVFVDEQDGFLFVVSFEKLAQEEKAVFHRFECCLAGRDAFKCSPHVIVHFILCKIFEGTVQSGKLPCDVFLHAFPGIPLDVFHRQKDDGPLPLLSHGFRILRDGQSVEELAIFFGIFEVEKALHHR